MLVKLSISIVTHDTNLKIFKNVINELILAIDYAISKNKITHVALHIIDNSIQTTYVNELKQLLSQYTDIKFFLLTIIILKNNNGYGQAHNLALKQLDSDYHIILNPDVLLHYAAIGNAVDFMKQNSDVGLISPNAVTELGEKLYLLKHYPALTTLFIRGFFPKITRINLKKQLEHYEMQNIDQTIPTKEVQIASGCFMFFRTKDIKNKFKFSRKFFLYFEDFDLTWQFSQDKKIAYVPSVKIIHYGGNAARKGLKHIYYFIRSAITFYNRFGWKFF